MLGPKRSQEPYSGEDEEVLAAIADSLSLAKFEAQREHHGLEIFRECPQCGDCYPADTETCEKDGRVLTLTSLPAVIGDRYRLVRRVGRGGMGTVYEAVDTALGRSVAVKVVREDLGTDAEHGVRFQTEARLAAGLVHPNVVTVHDVGVTAGDRPFLVMELLTGHTLREILETEAPFSARRVRGILGGICNAVEAAHQRQLIHRDLKPENVFVSGETPKIVDFGLAKALAPSGSAPATGVTRPGIVVGTHAYMSPEHLRGDVPSADWDLWAVAVMAFEMTTGTQPTFNGATLCQPEDVPGALRDVFARALSWNRLERPTSASVLYDELDQALGRDE